MDNRLGTSLAGFDVVERLGEGGSGVVYRVRDRAGRALALKVAKPELALSKRDRERFLSEAERMRRVEHPSVIGLVDVGVLDDGSPYIAMPLLEGETLAARVARGPLPTATALRIVREIGEGIAAIHEAGMLHRDVKPENVFLVGVEARAIVLDFGIARDVDGPATTTTREGRMRGTPAYMAPERFFGASPAVASEVYELATTLYVMLAGTLPWAGDDRGFDERLDPPPPETHGAVVPAHVSSALMRALSTRPEARPRSVEAFLATLLAPASVSGDRQTEDVSTRPPPATHTIAHATTEGSGSGTPVIPPPAFDTPASSAVHVSHETVPPARKRLPSTWLSAAAVALVVGSVAWVGSRGNDVRTATLRDACLAPSCAGNLALAASPAPSAPPSPSLPDEPTANRTTTAPSSVDRRARGAAPGAPGTTRTAAPIAPGEKPPAKDQRDQDAILLGDR